MDFSHTIFVSRLHAPRTVYCQALAALSDFVDLDHAIVTARDNCLSFLMMSNPLRFSDQQQIVTLMQPPEPSPPFGPKIDPGTDADTDPSSASKPENAIGIEVPQLDQAPRLSPINPMAAVLLLDVAAEHLARKGPHRLTVSAVAAGSGMTHANVYRYYPSKEGLIDAVIGRWLRSIEVELARIVEGPDPVEDKIEHLLVALATRQSDALIPRPSHLRRPPRRRAQGSGDGPETPDTPARPGRARDRGGDRIKAPSPPATRSAPSPTSSTRATASPTLWAFSSMSICPATSRKPASAGSRYRSRQVLRTGTL